VATALLEILPFEVVISVSGVVDMILAMVFSGAGANMVELDFGVSGMVASPNVQEPERTPADVGEKNSKRPWEKSSPPIGQPMHY
jgi:hypothetical protein